MPRDRAANGVEYLVGERNTSNDLKNNSNDRPQMAANPTKDGGLTKYKHTPGDFMRILASDGLSPTTKPPMSNFGMSSPSHEWILDFQPAVPPTLTGSK